ncbi:MAG: 5-methyltetrahydropteroyltriglutamate-homocysteine methyltransferase, nonfunctional [Candidatus Daviesbacteria bacterium GW2011_GWF2_38_6]|uniref:5-methyltetrahydropteroyltriglutamate-homocysteine methyltransferase, nonfunctional n=1 Tax=Candidatus Daviesbacteria bacterium GW2011_GWF2_38_6 TaxID=1618432 RepID=A0A0G0NKN4_9BACT|nr:MAG: 5-methyltetrahydropteroyltriglutamate-homocysteine methyltransferase, nonfunctional [Candidatus Daviesbacteria bacterium GW2011_GWF2_38_6]
MLMKIKQDKILTAIVGSYPKPKYIYAKSGRKLLDNLGFSFNVKNKNLDRACQEAIQDQNEAGIDLVTDGEERRGHYVLYVLKGLEGIDFNNLKTISIRGGIYKRDVPVVRGKIRYKEPILVDDFQFTKKYAKNFAKIGLPGPSTVVDCIADDYYQNLEKLAFDYAQAIRYEVADLIKAGCQIIQFDDPVLLRYPDRAKKWGLKALEACFKGWEDQATFIVHICCGYPNKPLEKKGIKYKANQDYYADVLEWFSRSKLDAVSIEGAQSKLDLSVLPNIGKKAVMLGVLDVGENRVESVDELVNRGQEALRYLPANQLILAPDCGMLQLSRKSSKAKLKNMAEAVKELNK